eukprot:395296-Rhodomonas_salina.1
MQRDVAAFEVQNGVLGLRLGLRSPFPDDPTLGCNAVHAEVPGPFLLEPRPSHAPALHAAVASDGRGIDDVCDMRPEQELHILLRPDGARRDQTFLSPEPFPEQLELDGFFVRLGALHAIRRGEHVHDHLFARIVKRVQHARPDLRSCRQADRSLHARG